MELRGFAQLELMSTLSRSDWIVHSCPGPERKSLRLLVSNWQDWCRVHYAPLHQATKCNQKDDTFGSSKTGFVEP